MSEFARNLAVVIGINRYDGGIAPLQTAANDAAALAQILREKHNYQVKLWVDEQATLTNFNHLFEELLPKTVAEGDRLLFYFAGHGIALNGEDGPEGYLIPQDARLGKVESYLPMSELNQALAKLPCRHFLAVLDCCFAGAFRWSSNRDVSTVPEVIHKERYDRFIQDPAWQVITSAAHDQRALDILTLRDRTGRSNANNHSPFAAALMDALSGRADSSPPAKDGHPAGDGVITATELYLYLRDQVERNTENSAKRQTPGLWCLKNHDKGEYIFLTPGHELNLPPAPLLDVSKNPYRGLASFEEEHSNLFFGRSTLTRRLQEFVVQHPLTVVLGASGSGKSSLVKAGLIPYLKQLRQTQKTQEQWKILGPICLGESPITALQSAVKDSISPLADVLAQGVELDEKTLVSSVAKWKQQHPDTKLLLVIDQFEELVTLCRDEAQREQLLKLLAHTLNSCSEQFHLLLTLRSDFEPQFRDTPLEGYWKDARFVVAAMTRGELREAIEEPASLRVIHFEPHNLIEQLIDEVAQMPGALPLLSFALSELYLKYLQRQDKARNRGETIDRDITQADYDELGGVTRSLTQRADQEYDRLVSEDTAYQQSIRNVMLRMVAVGGELARRRVPCSELEYLEPENTRVKIVIRRFEDARLITSGTDTESHPYVEPAHDILVRGWQRLLGWKQQDLANLLLQRELTPTANNWASSRNEKQASGLLWGDDPRLPSAMKLLLGTNYKDTWLNFVKWMWGVIQIFGIAYKEVWLQILKMNFSMRTVQENLRVKYGDTKTSNAIYWGSQPNSFRLNSIETEFVQRSYDQKFIQRYRTTAIITQIIILLLGLTIFAFIQLQTSTLREKALIAGNLLSTDPTDGLVSAIQVTGQNRFWFPWQKQVLTPVQSTLMNAVAVAGEQNVYTGSASSVAFSSDGKWIITNKGLWKSPENSSFQWKSPENSSFKENVLGSFFAISPDNSMIAGGSSEDKTVQLWSLEGDPKPISPPFGKRNTIIHSVAFSFDSKMVVCGHNDGTISLWDLKGNPIIPSFQAHQGVVTSVAFSQDDRMIVSGSNDGTSELWTLQGSSIKRLSQKPKAKVRSVAFSPDRKAIMSLTAHDNTSIIQLWNLQGNPTKQLLQEYEYPISSVVFSSDGKTVAFGSLGGTVGLWDIQKNTLIKSFRIDQHRIGVTYDERSGHINAIALSPDNKTIISVSEEGIRKWDLQGLVIGQPIKAQGRISFIAFSSDDEKIIAGTTAGSVQIWNLQGKLVDEPLQSRSNKDYAIAFSPDSKKIVRGGADGVIQLWDLQDNSISKLFQHGSAVSSVAFSPDGKTIVSSGKDRFLRLWDLEGNLLSEFLTASNPDASILSTVFSHNGKTLAVGFSDFHRFYKIQKSVISEGVGPGGNPFSPNDVMKVASFSPDGKLVVTGSKNGFILFHDFSYDSIWDQQFVGDYRLYFRGHNHSISSIAISPDSKTIVSGSDDGVLKFWDLEGNLIGQPLQGHEYSVNMIAFSHDGKKMASVDTEGNIGLWHTNNWKALLEVACHRLQHHPVLRINLGAPTGYAETTATRIDRRIKAGNTCQRYVWSHEQQ